MLGRLDSTEFGHLPDIRQEDFARQLKEILWLQKLTEIECQEFGAAAQTDQERALYARGCKKFINAGRHDNEDENPCPPALKEALLLVRPLFPVMCLVSTKDDVNRHAVDTDTRHEVKLYVLVWSDGLTIIICKQRLEHYLSTDVADSSRTVLFDFNEL